MHRVTKPSKQSQLIFPKKVSTKTSPASTKKRSLKTKSHPFFSKNRLQSPLLTTSTQTMSTPSTTTPQLHKTAHIIAPKGEHKRTVIFVHGLGDRGESFIDVFQMLNLKNTKVILPNAPVRPITCNGGYKMPGWYDIKSLDDRSLEKDEDVPGILDAVKQLTESIDYEAQLLNGNYESVAIGGFSQGSAVSQITSARLDKKLGAVVGLSGYALLGSLGNEAENNVVYDSKTPWFIYHGVDDEVVSVDFARKSQEYWQQRGLGANIQYSEEKGLGHSLSQKEIISLKKYLDSVGFV